MCKLDYTTHICSLVACIEKNIKGSTDYLEFEKLIGFSYRHIREVFQKVTRISLSRYILTRKIANAAFEIRHSVKSITELAFEYEFSNLDTFTRAFRRETGLTPSEFKKSEHLCGRKIICPGVYAPVILNLNNPRFTLHKFKEVNEMGEMVKTTDSCVLYGVPKVFYGREEDGHSQCTPFPMCLQAVLNYMGQNIGYSQIMATSGAAFRLRWNTKGWDLGAVDIRNTYQGHLKPFELAFASAGRSYKILEKADYSEDKFIDLIKSELDCGRPLIALGVVGPPEACIVTGYKNNGRALLGWSLFQNGGPFSGDFQIDESGYFIKNNWWDNIEAIMSIGEEMGEPAPLKAILKNALMLMTQETVECGSDTYYGGQAAYAAWAKAIEDDAAFPESGDISERLYCQGDAEAMLGEGRDFAALYLCSIAEKYPTISKEIKECAILLGAACKNVPLMWEARGGWGHEEKVIEKYRERQTRKQIAALIRQAAKCEKDACALLTEIIDML